MRGHRRRQGAPPAVRPDAEVARGGRAGGVALRAPAPGCHQEGPLEGFAPVRLRPVRGVLDEVAGAGERAAIPPAQGRRIRGTLLFVSMLSFTVVRVLPGDPALLIMGTEGNPAATARLRAVLGLDRPIPSRTSTGSGGRFAATSARPSQYDVPVGRLILSRLPVTVPLRSWPPCSWSRRPCRSACTRPRTTAARASTSR
jgi:Binding-prot-dependent transport system membrane comp, N-term